MFFRNVTFFSFPKDFNLNHMDDGFDHCMLKPVGSLELTSAGFVPPLSADGRITVSQKDVIWLTVGVEERIIPAAAVNKRLADKLAEIEKAEGRSPGGRTRKRIKEDLIHEMLPQAFVKPSRINAYIYPALGLVAIDTSSRKQAEMVISEIRRALGSFPAMPLNPTQPVRSVFTNWIAESQVMPELMEVGDECELRGPTEHGPVIRMRGVELRSNDTMIHLENGMLATKLGLFYASMATFVLSEDLTVSKFKLSDGVMDQLESNDSESVEAELMARFFLNASAISTIYEDLAKTFRVTPA